MPDTFGKRQRDAAKVRRRETKEARRAARKSGLLDSESQPVEFPDEGPARDGSPEPDGSAELDGSPEPNGSPEPDKERPKDTDEQP
jgi:hypothetical protein